MYKKITVFIICLSVILLYMSPYIILGEKSYLPINDNLDGPFVDYVLLARSGKIFSSLKTVLPQIANGISRNVFPSEFDLTLWFFYFFPPFAAYFVNLLLYRILAFFGMFLLLKKHILDKKINQLILFSVSLIFALLPFLSFGSGCIALLPLTFYIFLNIRKNKYCWYDWVILGFIPLYSNLPLVYTFFILFLGLLWLFDLIKYKKINPIFVYALITFSVLFLIKEYRLVYITFFDHSYISHRVEFVIIKDSISQCLQKTLDILHYGQYHAQSSAFPVLIISWIVAFLHIRKNKLKANFYWTTAIIFFFALCYGFRDVWFWKDIGSKITLLHAFDISRFFMLLPLFWYINWAYSLQVIWQIKKYGQQLTVLLIAIQLMLIFYKNEIVQGSITYKINFKQFFAEELFTKIKSDIGDKTNSFRIVSLGIHPSIASYNGFFTLDFYLNNYPLKYKHEFRQIISGELKKNMELQKFFDEWGSRCYLFSQDLPVHPWTKSIYETIKIQDLIIDTYKFKSMGGKYLFSAAEIMHPEINNLKFYKKYSNVNSAWDIYVYKLL